MRRMLSFQIEDVKGSGTFSLNRSLSSSGSIDLTRAYLPYNYRLAVVAAFILAFPAPPYIGIRPVVQRVHSLAKSFSLFHEQ